MGQNKSELIGKCDFEMYQMTDKPELVFMFSCAHHHLVVELLTAIRFITNHLIHQYKF